MSDPVDGTGSQVGLNSQQLNVGEGSAVQLQHDLSSGGQQIVIDSQATVPESTQVLPTKTTSSQNVEQSGVTGITNIGQPQKVVDGESLHLPSPGNDGKVSFVAITPTPASGQIKAAHPTLVTSLASPIKQPQKTSSAISPAVVLPSTSSSQPNIVVQANLSRKRPKLYKELNDDFFNNEKGPIKRQILDSNSAKLNEYLTKYVECVSELFFLESDGNIVEFHSWKSKRQNMQHFFNFLKSNKLDLDDEDEDLCAALALPDHDHERHHASGSSASHSATSQMGQPGPSTEFAVPSCSTSDKRSPTKQLTRFVLNPFGRQNIKQTPISVAFDASIATQEQILEKAKQEAYVVQRVSELQREGLWSEKRLPKVQEPPRNKAHWDYLLEEMVWLAADFAQERKWKKANAKKCAKMVQKHFQDKASMLKKEERSQELKLRKAANFIAKEIKNFWANVNKLVEYKQTMRIEEKRKKALDQHLSFIVDQTERYSSWLAEGMNRSGTDAANRSSASASSSKAKSPVRKTSRTDDNFEPNSNSEDDEETIAKEESDAPPTNNLEEIEKLKEESQLPLEELLKDLPEDYWTDRDPIPTGEDEDMEEIESNKSEDFVMDSTNETSDDEETLEEQEKAEGKVDYSKELAELEADNNMDIEELMAKYSAPPDPEASSVHEEAESASEHPNSEGSEDEAEGNEEDVGLKSLVDNESEKKETEGSTDENTKKEINDVAAIAESLQPKGNTLLTTSVVTPIPFLLKHPLREYQHIGLDWLVTMYDRKLNGILADEMGLGKTIQTIALLAHLACEKGNWGPHLIIVPTSVMLNWEMEIKKWCPAFKILTYYGTQKERKQKRAGWTKPNAFHICITSYKLVIQDHQSFRRKKWKYLILDEAQNIKNFKSQRWQLLLNFQTQRRLLLTGTPLQNNLMELWSLMHFLMPGVFQSHKEFKEWFCNPVTGMIEGNSEYNDAIIKRLHKVLRPFLLRRLKTEVERQLPKKYEHVVMCRLSNRQRYLYDDFMSRAKTKETLESGNMLSVINVLMQLRKVCNHPNLFEPRPIISPFQMDGIILYTASLVTKALEYDPFTNVDLSFLNLLFVNLEKMTAYVSYRIKKIKTPRKLIEEIDSAPPDPPPCPRAKVKVCIRNTDKAASQSLIDGKVVENMPPAKVGTSPLIKVLSLAGCSQGVSVRLSGSQINLLPHYRDAKSGRGRPSEGMQRKHITQTSSGRNVYFPGHSQAGSNTGLGASGQRPTTSKISMADVKLATTSSNYGSSTKSSNWYQSTVQAAQGAASGRTTAVTATVTATSTRTSSAIPESVTAVTGSNSQTQSSVRRADEGNLNLKRKRSNEKDNEIFKIPVVEERLKNMRKNKLSLISTINDARCEAYPMYGADLVSSMRIIDLKEPITNNWLCSGLTHCLNVFKTKGIYWYQTQYLNTAVKSPEEIVDDLWDILRRFVFYIPAVSAPPLELCVSHPSPSAYWGEKRDELALRAAISSPCNVLHPVASLMTTQFPDPRLIQYDCGKLQVLDKLLRKLKMNHHKVLLFTQMTRMLDVLEVFLNYHGHIYLRLDGTTKVDQRQALMERFNGDKRIFCFILSTRSGGIGINLTGADTVIFYDSDWNPTMDAQAQDRCHRIGQTRDVHIYRLISEMTVEENILKKANQKKLLGDVAIEGGNFTTAYFKSSTIQDLFNVDVSETDASRRMDTVITTDKNKKPEEAGSSGTLTHGEERCALGALESVLAAAEDESDVQATRTAKAEAAAELAEFDEEIPLDDANDTTIITITTTSTTTTTTTATTTTTTTTDTTATTTSTTDTTATATTTTTAATTTTTTTTTTTATTNVEPELSRAEIEVNILVEQLTPVERYAVKFVEENEAARSAEQLAAAEGQIERQMREWELGRLQALKEEEERRKQEEEPDEDLLTYSREDATNQVWLCKKTKELMPMWCPPTPPKEENDVYIDYTLRFLYEPKPIPDHMLPPVYVKKDLKRVRAADLSPGLEGRRGIKIHRKEDSGPTAPRSLFDHPSSALQKMRRDLKMQKYRGLVRPSFQIPGQKTGISKTSDSENLPEWTIHEDWALLQSIEKLQELKLNLLVINPGQTPNWDMVTEMVNSVSTIYRSSSQCRNRYESVIVPREEGKLQPEPKKQKKSKSVYKIPVTKSTRPVRTCQLYMQDNNATFTNIYHRKFENIKLLSFKRSPTLKPVLVNPTMKNPKHADVLTDSGISYEAPFNPIEIATMRAERIAKEKQKSMQVLQTSTQTSTIQSITHDHVTQQQLIQQRQIVASKSIVGSTSAGSVSVGIPIASAVAGNAHVMQSGTTTTTASVSTQNIVIASAHQISSVVPTATITSLRQARPVATIPVGIQEMVVAASQTRTASHSTAAVVSVAQIQGARIATGSLVSATIPTSVTTVKGANVPAVTVASAKTLNPAQIQYYRQQAILRQQQQRQQQLKMIQGQANISQSGVSVVQQKVTAVATVSGVTAVQQVSPSQQKAQAYRDSPQFRAWNTAGIITKGRQEEMTALMKQQIQRQQKTAVAVTQQPALTAQILAHAGLSVQTGNTGQAQVATLVKTSTGGQSVTIPMTGIAIPQVKAAINPQIKTAAGTTQPIRQLGLNYQQLLTKQGRGQATKVAQIAKPGLPAQLIVQSQSGKAVPAISMQQIQQVIKNVQPQHITVSAGQPVLQQGSQVVLSKSPQINAGTVQARVRPISGGQGSRQTIQVVPGTAIRAVPNVTIDASGRSQVSASSTLASALTGSIKVAQSASGTQQAFLSQVAASIPGIVRHQAGVSPVRIQTSTSATGAPLVAVTVQQQQIRTSNQNQPDNSQNQK